MILQLLIPLLVVMFLAISMAMGFQLKPSFHRPTLHLQAVHSEEQDNNNIRRSLLLTTTTSSAAAALLFSPHPTHAVMASTTNNKRCTDIETCREIGEQKDAELQKANPVTRLANGVRYKEPKAKRKMDPNS